MCSSKFVQLELLNKAKARTSKKLCSLRFSIHKFVRLNFFLDPIQKHALSRSVQLEAVYLEALLYSIFDRKGFFKFLTKNAVRVQHKQVLFTHSLFFNHVSALAVLRH